MPPQLLSPIVAGVDVGGERKGFHAVALQGSKFLAAFQSRSAEAVAKWCSKEMGATVIGVDAPCLWSIDRNGRVAERQLQKQRIFCFSTPTQAQAEEHRSNYYGWMKNGHLLYQALNTTHPLRSDYEGETPPRYCFETFPHAIAHFLSPTPVSARRKRIERLALLQRWGIKDVCLRGIDTIDAALCALTAQLLTEGCCQALGAAATGFIIIPKAGLNSWQLSSAQESQVV